MLTEPEVTAGKGDTRVARWLGVVLFPSSRPAAPLHQTPIVDDGRETPHWSTVFGKERGAWLEDLECRWIVRSMAYYNNLNGQELPISKGKHNILQQSENPNNYNQLMLLLALDPEAYNNAHLNQTIKKCSSSHQETNL